MRRLTEKEYMIFQSCVRAGDIPALTRLRDSDSLPDLMDPYLEYAENVGTLLPHELAARYGRLDSLRWLVEESGQDIRIFSRDWALVQAATYEHTDVVKWMLLESHQDIVLDLGPEDDWHTFDPEIQTLVESIDRFQKSHISLSLIQQRPELLDQVPAVTVVSPTKYTRRL